MIEKLMHRYALSRQGAKDLIKGIVACTLQNISFMLPVTLLYLFVKGLLNKSVKSNTFFFEKKSTVGIFVKRVYPKRMFQSFYLKKSSIRCC